MSFKRLTAISLVCFCFSLVPSCPASDVDLGEFVKNATIAYAATFTAQTSLETWNGLVDHPVLMGKLWEAYRFSPAYRVTGTATEVTAIDATGIEGNLVRMESSPTGRTYYGKGDFNHWAIPSFIATNVAITCRYHETQGKLAGDVRIHIKGQNSFTDLLLNLFSGIMQRRIDNRFKNNMGDLNKILLDIANHPDKPRGMLAGEALADFNRLFHNETR